MFGKYLLVKKSHLGLVGLAVAGVLGYQYYKGHREKVRGEAKQLADDVTEAVKKTAGKAKEVAKEVKP